MNWLKRLKTNIRSSAQNPLLPGEGHFYISQLRTQPQGIPSHEFLRFDGQGQVCGIEMGFSPGSIDLVVEQFNTITDDMLLKGHYQVDGPQLAFRLASSEIEVDYQGKITEGRLSLHWHSRKTNYAEDETYYSIATRQQLEQIAQALHSQPSHSSAETYVPTKISQLGEKAWEYNDKRDWLNAIRCFDQALLADSLNCNLYYGRGVIYCKTRNYTMSLADLNRALVLMPEFPAALAERGVAFLESGNLEQALKDYDRAIECDPTYAVAYINKGSLYALQGQWTQAVEFLSEGIRLSPKDDEVAYINRATAYEQLGKTAAAVDDLNHYLRVFPQGLHIKLAQENLASLEGKGAKPR